MSRLREPFPEVTVGDVYEHPTIGDARRALDGMGAPGRRTTGTVAPIPLKTQVGQVVVTAPAADARAALRWLAWWPLGNNVAAALLGLAWLPTVSWWWVASAGCARAARRADAARAVGARLLLRGVGPGDYPRGGKVHLRLWLAERLADELGAANLAGAPWMPGTPGCSAPRSARDVDLHTIPPVTGMLELGNGCSIEPEVDLSGHWVDGDMLHIGAIAVGADARIGARSMLVPRRRRRRRRRGGARVGGVRHGAGRRVLVRRAGAAVAGAARGPGRTARPQPPALGGGVRRAAALLGRAPAVAVIVVGARRAAVAGSTPLDGDAALARAAPGCRSPTLVGLLALAVLIWPVVRLLLGRAASRAPPGPRAGGRGRPGRPAGARRGPHLAVPAVLQLAHADVAAAARSQVGDDVEASTVLLIPKLTPSTTGRSSPTTP